MYNSGAVALLCTSTFEIDADEISTIRRLAKAQKRETALFYAYRKNIAF